jgi:hypothetical protein
MADEQDVRTNPTTGPTPSELEAKKAEAKSQNKKAVLALAQTALINFYLKFN